MREEIPWLLFQLSRMRFGTIGPSNHFVELQEVEEVLDSDRAARLGIQKGQITLQFHAGGGVLTGAVGALYGSRKGGNGMLKRIMRLQKPLHHLAGARSLAELRNRYALYFSNDCPPDPAGQRRGRAPDGCERGSDELRLRVPTVRVLGPAQDGGRRLRHRRAA